MFEWYYLLWGLPFIILWACATGDNNDGYGN